MDINNFGCFDAKVWGNVSDWAMVVVTFATGILIWLTLRSQTKVQDAQQQITDIEQEKYFDNIKPDFDCELVPPNLNTRIAQKNGVLNYKLILKSNGKEFKNLSYKFSDQMNDFNETQITRGAFDKYPTLNFSHPAKPMDRVSHLWIKYDDPNGNVYEIRFEIFLNMAPIKVGPYRQGIIFQSNAHELDSATLASFDLKGNQPKEYKIYNDQVQGDRPKVRFF